MVSGKISGFVEKVTANPASKSPVSTNITEDIAVRIISFMGNNSRITSLIIFGIKDRLLYLELRVICLIFGIKGHLDSPFFGNNSRIISLIFGFLRVICFKIIWN
jgi:hypothetical protein